MNHLIPRDQILIPTDRQRETITVEAIAALKSSLLDVGLINPVTLREVGPGTYSLIAGETRLRTLDDCFADSLEIRHGDSTIPLGYVPATLWSELSPLQQFKLEFEENMRRKPLTWKEEAAATQRMALLKQAGGVTPSAIVAETRAAMSEVLPSAVRNLSEVHQNILLGQHLANPEVAKAKSRVEAVKIVARVLQKAADVAATAASPIQPAGLIHGDALTELAKFADASFDAIVSDPPYGIGITQMSYQNASEQKYDDSYESWVPLMEGLVTQLARVLKSNAAGFLFCDFTRWRELSVMLEAAKFEVYPRPFIWDRSPDGRLTTPEKWPRRVYECILFFRRGDRALREFRGDVLSYPADRDTDNYHGAKKPVELYVDLLERIVGPGDSVIDPFAGSGPIVRAARQLSLNVWAIEGDDAYFQLMLRLSTPPVNPQGDLPL